MRGRIDVGLLVGLLLVLSPMHSAAQDAAADSDPVRFPEVTSENLEGREYRIPDGLPGELRLILLAFEQRQQRDVETWFPAAARIAEDRDDFTWWEFPTLQSAWRLMRWFIDGGMRSGIPDLAARERTITLYLDRPAFLEELRIPGPEQIAALLLDAEGRVIWRAYGRANEEKLASLAEAMQTP